jgi:hypothetical protein
MSAARPERQRRHEQKDAPDRAPKGRTPGMHRMYLMSELPVKHHSPVMHRMSEMRQ